MPNSSQNNAYYGALTSGKGVIRDQLGNICVVGAQMAAGAATGNVLASDAAGNLTLQPISAASIPAATTTTQGAVIFDGTATDITADGGQAAGSIGKVADSGHVHPGRDYYMRASTILGETVSRAGQLNGTYGTGTTGTLSMFGIFLPAGSVVGHLSFATGSAGISGPTHWWFGLYDSSLNQLAVTADQTNTAWSSGTYTSLAIATTASGASSTFTTTYTGLHYVGVMVAYSGSAPNLLAVQQVNTGVIGLAPVLGGTSDTGASTPPSFPHQATALTPVAFISYGTAAA